MASFARSFKPPPPGFLSPYRRPSMPARTLSNSSDLSNASGGADETGDAVVSPISGRQDSGTSRPIAIEPPTIRKPNTYGSVRTPPEPLSARGDLPGGYFPMHEDPKGRVHRPHPFHQDSRRQLSDGMHVERKELAQPTMPVASYLAPGFHDSPLPVGKYYPSNWEQRRPAHSPPDSRPSSVPRQYDSSSSRSSSGGTDNTNANINKCEAEARRKMMQQYQRDMIAQAAMGLGGSAKTAGKQATTTTTSSSSLAGLPLKDVWLAVPSSLRPASPRLHPLGSPGPVTPMDLEAAGYLDHHHHHHHHLTASKPHRDWSVAEHRTAAGITSHSP
ncbi:hypothetical protein CP533_0127 [Ophiocordyceps camponoti-saundersi (nom. inval.)]|nr:hypothetical protein CP533_0127 [Ophiocordyceps camponoti-saundersi (nom. inval.)]